jgi:hypothetical protein
MNSVTKRRIERKEATAATKFKIDFSFKRGKYSSLSQEPLQEP